MMINTVSGIVVEGQVSTVAGGTAEVAVLGCTPDIEAALVVAFVGAALLFGRLAYSKLVFVECIQPPS